jgi:hypothetical protein
MKTPMPLSPLNRKVDGLGYAVTENGAPRHIDFIRNTSTHCEPASSTVIG